jgi:hypothetical protein
MQRPSNPFSNKPREHHPTRANRLDLVNRAELCIIWHKPHRLLFFTLRRTSLSQCCDLLRREPLAQDNSFRDPLRRICGLKGRRRFVEGRKM